MLSGRAAEIKYLKNCYQKEDNQVIVLYGRKDVGKTALLQAFSTSKYVTFYRARECSEEEQKKQWMREITGEEPEDNALSYEDIFSRILEVKTPKRIIIIEEFQHIVRTSEGFLPTVIQTLHNRWNLQKLMIVLVSSSIAWVENAMVKQLGKTAYEINGLLKVGELKFPDLVQTFPALTMKQCVETYAILGGVPGLWQFWDDTLSVKDNICAAILSRGAFLQQEGLRHVSAELRELSVYNTILAALAAGKNKLNDLYRHTGFSRAKISVYLKNLMELEIIEKVFSYDTPGREHTQKGIYRICDSYVYFWYKYIYANYSHLNWMEPEKFYDSLIAPDFSRFAAGCFKKVCMEYMELMNRMDRLEIRFERCGSWHGKVGDIDILGQDAAGRTISGICGWEQRRMSFDDYEWLRLCEERAKVNTDYYYLFSAAGFDEALVQEAEEKGNIHLIDLEQM